MWNGSKWTLTGNANDRINGIIRKAADQSIASNIVSQNDNDLFFPVTTGETWMYQITGVIKDASATPGFRAQMNVPAGSTGCSNTLTDGYNTVTATNIACSTDLIIAAASLHSPSDQFTFVGVFKAWSTGTARFKWAQNVSNASAIIVAKDTVITYTRLSGADIAEVYYSDDNSVSEWDIISLNGNGVSQVSKSSQPYDSKALGIVSTKPWLVIGEADGAGKPVIVGLSGRVPVKVSTKNGDIQPGDYITTSDIPGVGMKATEAGRVIGKALTGLSGTDEWIVAVFIQNTYFDGINEAEYSSFVSSIQSGSILGDILSPLDRFSFMVNKSLGKIDPNFSSWGLAGFGAAMNAIEASVNTLSGNLNTVSGQIMGLSNDINDIRSQMNTFNNTGTAVPIVNNQISSEDQSLLDAIIGALDSLIVQVKTTFSEMVTFVKSVVFQSTVTFEERITFKDTDMAGTATIQAGSSSVHITFTQAYTTIPKITVTADTFVTYRVASKSQSGFTIETQVPVTENTSFDWIALLVPWTIESISNNSWEWPLASDTDTGAIYIPETIVISATGADNEVVTNSIEPSIETPTNTGDTNQNDTTESTGTITPIIPSEITDTGSTDSTENDNQIAEENLQVDTASGLADTPPTPVEPPVENTPIPAVEETIIITSSGS